MDRYYKDTDMSSDGLMVPNIPIKFYDSNSNKIVQINGNWLDYFYRKNLPLVDIDIFEDDHTEVFCSDKKTSKFYMIPGCKKTVTGLFFLDTNDTAIAFMSGRSKYWVRISLLPEADKDRRNELLVAKMMLPTPIWMLMCILDFDYDTLNEEVLQYETDLQ